jgi:hypothetical protein
MSQNDWKHEIQIASPQGVQTFDLTNVQFAESRIHEVAFVTPQKAGELLATFNTAHLELVTIIAKVELAIRRAERTSDKLRSIIVLDKVKDILKQKGLAKDSNPAGSEDLRRAILDGDDEYQDALDKVEELKALGELLRNKSKSIEMAYHSVKKLIADTFIPNQRETRTNGYFPEDVEAGQSVPAQTPGRGGYVKPKT